MYGADSIPKGKIFYLSWQFIFDLEWFDLMWIQTIYYLSVRQRLNGNDDNDNGSKAFPCLGATSHLEATSQDTDGHSCTVATSQDPVTGNCSSSPPCSWHLETSEKTLFIQTFIWKNIPMDMKFSYACFDLCVKMYDWLWVTNDQLMQTSENVKCQMSSLTLFRKNPDRREQNTEWDQVCRRNPVEHNVSLQQFVRQQVVTKLATNFTTRLTRQDHRPGHRNNDGADTSQQKKARCTISSQALEICTKLSMCTNWTKQLVCQSVSPLVIHQIQSVRCYNKLVTDLSRFILGKEGECGSHTRLIQIQIHLSRFLLEEKGKCGWHTWPAPHCQDMLHRYQKTKTHTNTNTNTKTDTNTNANTKTDTNTNANKRLPYLQTMLYC